MCPYDTYDERLLFRVYISIYKGIHCGKLRFVLLLVQRGVGVGIRWAQGLSEGRFRGGLKKVSGGTRG